MREVGTWLVEGDRRYLWTSWKEVHEEAAAMEQEKWVTVKIESDRRHVFHLWKSFSV